ncbi:IS200/IS605 family transposase [aff. Roholtiella sp. LEGE 12411]|uniref:IS200/IS605 family transposase n=1 Tax=aff. Roholtiella sp. LEGE 12411 TaxID=1828822 RepID=UPI0018809290|nr:IS200/IS605 family transposase [aff. Roholtiella sp. LEGE 12411]MBE9033823.1 IS200/IS605 family transposase [aff. Roholtiella sp. LEGE 12411]
MEVKHGRGYVYAIEYHIVWCVKYRHKVLKDEIADFLKDVLVETAILYKFKVESLEVVEDHVHVLVSATPQHTIPNIVKMLKGISARKLFLKFPQLKKKLWGGHLWNPSYFVSTVSENTEAQVKKYIENQNAESEKPRGGVPPVEGTFQESV